MDATEELPRAIIDSHGNFQNPFHREEGGPSFWKFISFTLSHRKPKVPPKEELDIILPVLAPDWQKLRNPPSLAAATIGGVLPSLSKFPASIQATWIGHATFFVQMEDGLSFLTDPIFSERASPVSFAGPKRYRPVPMQLSEVPKVILLLSSSGVFID